LKTKHSKYKPISKKHLYRAIICARDISPLLVYYIARVAGVYVIINCNGLWNMNILTAFHQS